MKARWVIGVIITPERLRFQDVSELWTGVPGFNDAFIHKLLEVPHGCVPCAIETLRIFVALDMPVLLKILHRFELPGINLLLLEAFPEVLLLEVFFDL